MSDSQEEKSLKKIMTRRQALKYIALGGVGIAGACYGLKRADVLHFLDEDAKRHIKAGPVTTRPDNQGHDVSLLGFGCMRFPMLNGVIDEEMTLKMVDYAYRHGVNYYDTAYIYHGGKSEEMIGKALSRYPRESYYLANKMPTWLVDSLESAKSIFQEQMDRCGVQYFDYYLLHSLKSYDQFKQIYLDYGVWNYLKEERRKGRIKHLGFSFHGDMNFFEYLMKWYDEAKPEDKWEFVQIQLNYFDWDDPYQQSGKLYKMLEDRNIHAVIMEPVRGGMLATLNPGCAKMLKEADPERSVASWAIRYCASFPKVLTVLSGMSQLEHVIDNIDSLTDFQSLTDEQMALLYKIVTIYKANKPIPCTTCRYCMPCPYGVDIPGIFMVYNECVDELNMPNIEGIHDSNYYMKRRMLLVNYNNSIQEEARAHHCIRCKKCESVCPQHIRVSERLGEIEDLIKTLNKKFI